MTQSELTDYQSTVVDELPYPVPFPDGTNEDLARTRHREWYWSEHDLEEYECPDCDRGLAEVNGFDVHHIDRNPLNGDPDNIIGLCQRCHAWRHSDKRSISGLTNEEWRDEFMNITESEFVP